MSRAICVLGMMRTGTSAVAGVLELLGAHFGPAERLIEPNVANPTGFREHRGILDVNNELLGRLGGTWFAPPEIRAGWEDDPTLDDLRERAAALVASDLETHDVWAWKDPRACLTLPFWKRLVPDLLPVVCLREPAEAARSFAELGQMGWTVIQRLSQPFETGLDLWLRYTTDALDHSDPHVRLLVFYEDVLADPGRESERLAVFAGLSERLTAQTRAAIGEFLSPALRHHVPADAVRDHAAHALYGRLREQRDS